MGVGGVSVVCVVRAKQGPRSSSSPLPLHSRFDSHPSAKWGGTRYDVYRSASSSRPTPPPADEGSGADRGRPHRGAAAFFGKDAAPGAPQSPDTTSIMSPWGVCTAS